MGRPIDQSVLRPIKWGKGGGSYKGRTSGTVTVSNSKVPSLVLKLQLDFKISRMKLKGFSLIEFERKIILHFQK